MDYYLIKMFEGDTGTMMPEIAVMWLLGFVTWQERIKPMLEPGVWVKCGDYYVQAPEVDYHVKTP